MSGLRTKNKQRNQKNIIQSARKLFRAKGVQNTSIAEIAKDAGVGTGTVYNYFSSKGALLLGIFAEDMADIQPDNQINVSRHHGNLVDDVMDLMEKLSVFFTHYPKTFWREMLQVLPEEVEENEFLRKGFFELDGEAITWTKQIIEQHSDSFLVPVDAQEAAMAIYSIVATQALLFFYEDNITYEQYMKNMKRQIEFIFSGKLK